MFSCTPTVFCKRGLIGHHSPTEIYFTFILMFESIKILTILKTFTVFSQKGWMAPGIRLLIVAWGSCTTTAKIHLQDLSSVM